MNDLHTVPENDELEIVFAEISGEGRCETADDEDLFDEAACGDDGEELPAGEDEAVLSPRAPGLLERFAGLTAALSFLAFFTMLQGVRPGELLLQPVVFGMIASVTIGGMILSHGPRRVFQLLGVMFGGRAHDDEHADELQALCRRGRRLCYAVAFVAAVLGVIQVLQALDQPDRIGAGLATTLVALVHGTILAELGFGSAQHWVRARAD